MYLHYIVSSSTQANTFEFSYPKPINYTHAIREVITEQFLLVYYAIEKLWNSDSLDDIHTLIFSVLSIFLFNLPPTYHLTLNPSIFSLNSKISFKFSHFSLPNINFIPFVYLSDFVYIFLIILIAFALYFSYDICFTTSIKFKLLENWDLDGSLFYLPTVPALHRALHSNKALSKVDLILSFVSGIK